MKKLEAKSLTYVVETLYDILRVGLESGGVGFPPEMSWMQCFLAPTFLAQMTG